MNLEEVKAIIQVERADYAVKRDSKNQTGKKKVFNTLTKCKIKVISYKT